MNISLANNSYLILTPYEIQEKKSLIFNNTDTNCLGKVAFDFYDWKNCDSYVTDEIVIFDVNKSQKYIVGGKEYIIIKSNNVIGRVSEGNVNINE